MNQCHCKNKIEQKIDNNFPVVPSGPLDFSKVVMKSPENRPRCASQWQKKCSNVKDKVMKSQGRQMPDLTGCYNPNFFTHQGKLCFFYCRNISKTRESECKGMINFRQAQCHSTMPEVLAPPSIFLILLKRSSEMNIAPVIQHSS